MPPFSGKMKKAQLNAKRLRKKEAREQEKASEGFHDTAADAMIAGDASTVTQGRQPGRLSTNLASSMARHHEDSSTAASCQEECDTVMDDAHRHGIRSAFRKETQEEIEARRRLNFLPLCDRQAMPASGIPFGEWFQMPRRLGEGASLKRTLPIATAAAAVPSLVSSDGTVSIFPIAFELPSRGWCPATSAAAQDIDVLPNQTILTSQNDATMKRGEDDAGDGAANADVLSTGLSLQERIESVEEERFAAYRRALEAYPLPEPLQSLPLILYEQNLEVWRQLWRTVELSDVTLLVTDARYPIVHLHLGMLSYLTRVAQKPCVVVLNKADLVPQAVLDAWLRFLPAYLGSVGLRVLRPEEAAAAVHGGSSAKSDPAPIVLHPFTANPVEESAVAAGAMPQKSKRLKKRQGKLYENLRAGKVSLSKPHSGNHNSNSDDDDDDDDDLRYDIRENFRGKARAERNLQQDKRAHEELRIVSGMITQLLALCRSLAPRTLPMPVSPTLPGTANPTTTFSHFVHVGFLGFPNVGKSSLLNCIGGTKVVSVSATPGHSKHLQTIPLVEEGVVLVDCPGLVAPLLGLPRPLQAVLGTHPIAQTRDPPSGVAYLASHLPLERLYGLRRPEGAVETEEWSAYDLCEAYAQKRGYYAKHGKGALDVHRAAIRILQEAYQGQLSIFLAPPEVDFLESEHYEKHIKPFLLLRVFEN